MMIVMGYVAHTEEKRNMQAGIWWGNLKERDYLEYLDTDGNNPPTEHMQLSIIIQSASFDIILIHINIQWSN